MTVQELKLGDVIEVPFAGKYALCKTIYLSSIVKCRIPDDHMVAC
jgi:hypothetical protein